MLGAQVTLEALEGDPHALLRRLREEEPVSWVAALGGWLVTRYDLALAVMRDASTFTVDDPRFSTAQVIGPSMLSLDGREHERHRQPFVAPFRPQPLHAQYAIAAREEAELLLDQLGPAGGTELRGSFAGPLASAVIARLLGLDSRDSAALLGWYRAIVGSVNAITAGAAPTAEGESAFLALAARLEEVMESHPHGSLLATAAAANALTPGQLISNAAVLLFGGIETMEGMILNAMLVLLQRPEQLTHVRDEPRLLDAAIEESLRLEPAAAAVDRYATRDHDIGGASVAAGDLVRVSIAAANRDPAVFADPDRFELARPSGRHHLAFAQGPHVCLGVHLARLEARTALELLFERLPDVRLDPKRPALVCGLVFRKPAELHVRF